MGYDEGKFSVYDDEKRLDPQEYFVLRRGDVLAITTLRSYASHVMAFLELGKMGLLILTIQERRHLKDLADHVSSLSYDWEEDDDLKLPD